MQNMEKVLRILLGFNPLAGIRAFQTQWCGLTRRMPSMVSIPLRGLGLFRPSVRNTSPWWQGGFNPLAGIRAFQT